MRRLALLTSVLTALILTATAGAKGPAAATIDGPGTGGGISLGGNGEPGSGAPLGNLSDQAGLFAAAFGQTPDPMLAERPKGNLGPRYTITYRLPGPNGEDSTIRQDAYPYAQGGPVLYTDPGQRFFGTRKTVGGWYRASPELKTTLVKAGLPATAPSDAGGSDSGTAFADFWPAVAVGFALALAAITAVFVRRRPRAAAAS
jgi:hypothetical protein